MYPMSLRQTSRGFASEVNLSSQDVFNVFEGDVPTHHVIKQHAKRPDSGTVTMVEGSVPGESRHQVYIYIYRIFRTISCTFFHGLAGYGYTQMRLIY